MDFKIDLQGQPSGVVGLRVTYRQETDASVLLQIQFEQGKPVDVLLSSLQTARLADLAIDAALLSSGEGLA